MNEGLLSQPTPGGTQRLTQLDSLRGLAALTVFFEHFTKAYDLKSSAYNFAYFSPLHILWDGHGAVLLFFLLSGFVLSLPFINNDKPLHITEFYFKRVFRIYPAFILSILIALFLKHYLYDTSAIGGFSLWFKKIWTWNNISGTELFKTFILIDKFNPDLIIPAIWSLIIEMRISLLLPFLIIIASRANLLFNILFFFVLTYWGINSETALGVFYIGILIAKYRQNLINLIHTKSTPFIILLVLVASLLYNIDFTLRLNTSSSMVRGVINYSIAIGSGIFIVILISKPILANFLKKPIFIFFGDVSYSFYLLHMPILYTMCSIFSFKYTLSPVYILVSSLIISWILSFLVFVLIEKPFQKLAKNIVNNNRAFRRSNLRG